MTFFKKNYFYVALIFLLTVFSGVVFGNFFPIPFVDVGREFLIPKMILDGELIYRDILNIYGAIPYYLLALLYKTLNISFYTYALFNSIIAFGILFGLYELSKEFFSKKYSFLIVLCVWFLNMNTSALYSYIQPYSYCYTMAYCAFVFSLLFFIKYFKKQKDLYICLSMLFAGFTFATKNDLCFLPVALVFLLIIYKKINFKNFTIVLFSFLFIPILQIWILSLNGLDFQGFLYAIVTTIKSAMVPSMTRFHKVIGMLPMNDYHLKKILSIFYIIIFFLVSKFLVFSNNKKKIKLGYVLFGVLVILGISFSTLKKIFFPLPIFTTILILFFFKKLYKKPSLLALGLCSIVASLKTYVSLYLGVYGEFTIVLLAIFMFAFLSDIKKEYGDKIIHLFLIYCFANFLFNILSFANIGYVNYEHKTHKIKLLQNEYVVLKRVVDWIENNTQSTDKILVFPEGGLINVVCERKTHPMFYNLHDINIETFGYEYIKNNIDSMDYIIDVSDFQYDSKTLSFWSYQTGFINYVMDNKYKPIKTLVFHSDQKGTFKVIIYKKL